MRYRQHIDPTWLAQYVEHGAPATDISGLRRHLQHCSVCAEAYVRLRLDAAVRREAAPASIWPSIESKIQGSEQDCAPRRGFPLGLRVTRGVAACIAGIFIASAALIFLSQRAERATLDVGQYLASLETTDTGPNTENLHRLFAQFGPYDRSRALLQTRLQPRVGAYHLIDERISPANIVQLVYDSGRDVFALFVAPRTATLDFGGYHLVGADLGGVRCRRVQCPRQDIYLLTTNARQYLFVRRHTSIDDSDRLFTALIQGAP